MKALIHSGEEWLSETRGSQPAVPQLSAFAVGSFSQRTLNARGSLGVASWILEPGQWLLSAERGSAKGLGSSQWHKTFGVLQTACRSASPFECLDLDTLEGFNFHKVLNTHILKNRTLETCHMKSLGCCLLQNVCSLVSFSNVKPMILKKSIKYGQRPKALTRAFFCVLSHAVCVCRPPVFPSHYLLYSWSTEGF